MKTIQTALMVFMALVFTDAAIAAAPTTAEEGTCAPGLVQDRSGLCAEPGDSILQPLPEVERPLQTPGESDEASSRAHKKSGKHEERDRGSGALPFTVYFFWGEGCPHCGQEKLFLSDLKKAFPAMKIRDFEVWHDGKNAALFSRMLAAYGIQASGVPVTIIDRRIFIGYSTQTRHGIEEVSRACGLTPCIDPSEYVNTQNSGGNSDSVPVRETGLDDSGSFVDVPFFGKLDAREASLPVMTIMIAGLDSFNPCAFFVLLSLLGLLVYARSRRKMLLIGAVFVFFSGFIYFLFMAAWLNLFLVMGQVAFITSIAGGVSVVIAAINIKDFFIFKKGISLTIPDSAKPDLFERMRRLIRTTSLPSILVGTSVLAIVANSYELLCTAGFPMIFTRILTLKNLPQATYYLYLLFYNLVYVLPLFLIVFVFAMTLGSRKLSEWQGRVLKLVSGTMMLGLGGVLLVNPALLNSLGISLALMAGSLAISFLVASGARRFGS